MLSGSGSIEVDGTFGFANAAVDEAGADDVGDEKDANEGDEKNDDSGNANFCA